MLIDEFACTKANTGQTTPDFQYAILQGIVKPRVDWSIDILKEAQFHIRKISNPDEDLISFDMSDCEPEKEWHSHIDVTLPPKIFYMENKK